MPRQTLEKAEVVIIRTLIEIIVLNTDNGTLLARLSAPGINWQLLTNLASLHELCPFLYFLTLSSPELIPDDYRGYYKEAYLSCLFTYEALHQEMLRINSRAQKENITLIPLKGLSFVDQYYQRFNFRPLSDIDLLVHKSSLTAALTLLEQDGYRKHLLGTTEGYWRTHQCHLGLLKHSSPEDILTEVHWEIDVNRYKKEVLASSWQRLKRIRVGENEVTVLSPEDALFSLALHARRYGKVLNLKYACDSACILSREKIDWDYMRETARKEKMTASLYFLLAQTQTALPQRLNIPWESFSVPQWKRKAFTFIFNKYLFAPVTRSQNAYLYTLCHFLLYDSLSYPLNACIALPQEQFAKFYDLPFSARTTSFTYALRFLYIPYRSAVEAAQALEKAIRIVTGQKNKKYRGDH